MRRCLVGLLVLCACAEGSRGSQSTAADSVRSVSQPVSAAAGAQHCFDAVLERESKILRAIQTEAQKVRCASDADCALLDVSSDCVSTCAMAVPTRSVDQLTVLGRSLVGQACSSNPLPCVGHANCAAVEPICESGICSLRIAGQRGLAPGDSVSPVLEQPATSDSADAG